jgi:hypothetical protein
MEYLLYKGRVRCALCAVRGRERGGDGGWWRRWWWRGADQRGIKEPTDCPLTLQTSRQDSLEETNETSSGRQMTMDLRISEY